MPFFTQQFLLQSFGTVIAVLLALYFYFKYVVYNYWRSRGIPQVEPVVPFGSLLTLIKSGFGKFFRDSYLRFRKSPVIGFYVLYRRTLVVNDPDLVRFVLTKEFAHFHDRGLYSNEKVDPLTAHLVFLNGSKWKNLRAKLTPTFTSGKMKHMFSTVEETGNELVESVVEIAKEKKLVDIKDLMSRYATDIIATVAFGIKCESLKNPNNEFRTWGRKIFTPKPLKNALLGVAPGVLKLFDVRITERELSDFFIGLFKEVVEYRIANNVVRKDFLDLLIQLMNKGYVHDDDGKMPHISENADGKITMLEGAAQAFIFWAAGFETSSATATFCLVELAVDQDVQTKLSDEIKSVIEKFGGLTYESVNAMTYLHKVISETLRKYPPLPMLSRICVDNIELPGTGLMVEKGTQVIIPVMGLHLDPDVFPNPDSFDPERFNEENISTRHQYSYLPFGEGPRNCIGSRFGLLQTKIGIASLLSKYRFKPGPNFKYPVEFDAGNFLLMSKSEIMLRIEER